MRHTFLIFFGLLLTTRYAASLRTALDQTWEKSSQDQTPEAKCVESDAQGDRL